MLKVLKHIIYNFQLIYRLPIPPDNLRYATLMQPSGIPVNVDYEIVQGDDLIYYCLDPEAVLSDGSRQNYFRTKYVDENQSLLSLN